MFIARPLKITQTTTRYIHTEKRVYTNKLNQYIDIGYVLKDDVPDELINDALEYCLENYNNRYYPFLYHKTHNNKIDKMNVNLLVKIVEEDTRSLKWISEDMYDNILSLTSINLLTNEIFTVMYEKKMKGHTFNKYFNHEKLYLPYKNNKIIKYNEVEMGSSYDNVPTRNWIWFTNFNFPVVYDIEKFKNYYFIKGEYWKPVKIQNDAEIIFKEHYLQLDEQSVLIME